MPTKSKKKAAASESKKSLQKKKEKMLEDKTFGLKNKKKSKVVQAQIRSIEKSVMNSGDPKERKKEEMRKKAKAENKARKKAMEEERNALFGEALMAVKKKGTTSGKAGAVEAKGRDADDDDKKKGTSRAMKMMYQMDANEMAAKLREDPNYVPTLEDEIEYQRQQKVAQLKASGKTGTPVTEKTFREWQERKRKRKAEESKKLVEAEMRKKKGGKGLSVLSGRALYEYKKELFDNDNDDNKVEDNNNNNNDGSGNNANQKVAAAAAAAVDTKPQSNNEKDESLSLKEPPELVNAQKEKQDGSGGGGGGNDDGEEKDVKDVAERVQTELFLEGDDDDLDDIEDD